MSTDARVRFRLGTRLALLGAGLLLIVWGAAAWAWVRDARTRVTARTEADAATLLEELDARLRRELDRSVDEVPWAVRVATAATRAEGESGSRSRGSGAPAVAPRERLTVELAGSGLAATWLRRLDGDVTWSFRGRPVGEAASPRDGPCFARLPGGGLQLARCTEVAAGANAPGEWAGGLRVVDLSDVPGRWVILAPGPPPAAVAVSDAWPGGLPGPGGAAILLDGVTGREEGARVSLAGEPAWMVVGRPLGVPVRLLAAVEPPVELRLGELLRGDAGPLTDEWRDWLGATAVTGVAALLLFAASGASLNRSLAPLVAAADAVGRADLPRRLPLERTDELGVLAVTLAELAARLRGTRKAWEHEAAGAAWRDAARALAHELKNPLLPVKGTLENLARWRREDPGRFEELVDSRLATVLGEVEHLKRLAASLSALAQLPAPRPRPGDLNALVREVVELHAQASGRTTVEARLAEGLPPVSFDAGQLRQVLANLVANAREAMEPTGGRVTVETREDRGGVTLAVTDEGPGASDDTLARMFRPGFSTKLERGGQGLGLFLCRRMLSEVGASIDVERTPDAGLRVFVRLALGDAHPEAGGERGGARG